MCAPRGLASPVACRPRRSRDGELQGQAAAGRQNGRKRNLDWASHVAMPCYAAARSSVRGRMRRRRSALGLVAPRLPWTGAGVFLLANVGAARSAACKPIPYKRFFDLLFRHHTDFSGLCHIPCQSR